MGCCFVKDSGEDDVFSKYDFGERIGQGGFGQVLTVVSKATKQERAVKIIVRKEAADAGGRDIHEEGEIMSKMQHPNVVKLYDIYTDDMIVYLVMEKCHGGELFAKLEQEICVLPSDAINITRQMLEAVSYVHTLNIVHRDIKPENWLFSRIDSCDGLKLIDFGLAKRIVDGEKLKGPCGTLHYVAPETLTGNYEYQVDVWGVGIILYLMLLGFYPFDGDNTKRTMRAIVRSPLEFPTNCSTKLSPTAEAFLSGLLAKDPLKRLTTHQALEHRWLNEVDKITQIGVNALKDARKTSVQVSVEPETERRRNEALLTQAKRQPSTQRSLSGELSGRRQAKGDMPMSKVVPGPASQRGQMQGAPGGGNHGQNLMGGAPDSGMMGGAGAGTAASMGRTISEGRVATQVDNDLVKALNDND